MDEKLRWRCATWTCAFASNTGQNAPATSLWTGCMCATLNLHTDMPGSRLVLIHTAQFAEQILRMDRFGQYLEIVTLCMSLLQQIGGGCLAGKKQDLDGWQQGANADGGINAVQVGHDDIGDQHVGLEGGRKFKGFFAGIHGACLKAALVQDHGQGVGDDPFVIGDKDFGFVNLVGHMLLDTVMR